ncbi:unnamed protein product [Malus baccata var. baccata]
MSASLTLIYGEAAPKSRTRDLPLMGEGTCPYFVFVIYCDSFILIVYSSGNAANGQITSERSATPLLPDFMDSSKGYLHNYYMSAAYYYGGSSKDDKQEKEITDCKLDGQKKAIEIQWVPNP